MDNMQEWQAATNVIGEAVEEAIKASGQEDVYVIYSAYDIDDNDIPINNLNEVAAEGTFRVKRREPYFGNGKVYDGGEVTNPTWLELAVHNNASILHTQDGHHVFFEGFNIKDGVIWMYNGS